MYKVNRKYRWLSTLAVATVAAGILGPTYTSQAATSLVRLTPDEYRRTISDIFGPAIRVSENKVQPGFRDEGLLAVGERRLTITSAELERYERLAQEVAVQVVEPRRRDILVQCTPKSETAPDDACAADFLKRSGALLLRRPLKDAELAVFVKVHHEAAKQLSSFNDGLAFALSRLLVDPEFLFRVERTLPAEPDAKSAPLEAYSRATRLSFLLWDSAPDNQLLQAAESGRLMTEEGLKEQVQRMLQSPRMEHGVRAFFVDMLHFDKFATLNVDTVVFPQFTKNVQEDAREQTLRTVVDHLLHKNGQYRDLFTTRHTFLTPSLAAVYNVPLPRAQEIGGAVPWVPFAFGEQDPYVGLLSHVSFLSLHSHPARTSPTLRGRALREVFFCQKVPPPPGEVDFNLVQDTSNPKFKTVRQRLTAHNSEPLCAGCHKITDPMGFAMENFTTGARFRRFENGVEIDTTGSLNGKDFDGMQELATVVRNDPAATSCLIRRAFSYGTARHPNSAERRWLTGLQKELGPDGVTWRELMSRVVLAPDFFTLPIEQPKEISADAR